VADAFGAAGAAGFRQQRSEIYLTLAKDLENHLSCVRDAYSRLRSKGYHFVYREFDELGDRTYHPRVMTTRSRGDAAAQQEYRALGEETKLLKLSTAHRPPRPWSMDAIQPWPWSAALPAAILQKLLSRRRERPRRSAETCKHGVFGDPQIAALTKLVSDPSVKVRQAAIARSDVRHWRYTAARRR